MATQLTRARTGEVTDEMRQVASDEGLDPEKIRAGVAGGTIVIPHNVHRDFSAVGIGQGLRTKVNANIGASGLRQSSDEEVVKLELAVQHGADSVMDLSTGTDLDAIRQKLLDRSPVMLGTVPIYQVAAEMAAGQVVVQNERLIGEAKSNMLRTAKTVYFEAYVLPTALPGVVSTIRNASDGNCQISHDRPSHGEAAPSTGSLAP